MIERERMVKIKWAELTDPTWEKESSLPLPLDELPTEHMNQIIWAMTKDKALTEFATPYGVKPVAELFAEERPTVEQVRAHAILEQKLIPRDVSDRRLGRRLRGCGLRRLWTRMRNGRRMRKTQRG